jgi:hypothetical protein
MSMEVLGAECVDEDEDWVIVGELRKALKGFLFGKR